MRILFADANHPVLHETLIAAGFDCDLFWDKSVQGLKELLPEYQGLVIRSRFKINADVLDSAPLLKCIGRVGAGMENIDLDHAKRKGIDCICVPEGNRDAVGEHTIGMLLMLLNNLKKADNEVRQGIWLRDENRGHELKDKTVGIIGFGNMGSAFALRLSGFGCKILAYDKYKKGFGNDAVIETDLPNIYASSDILSIHVPLTEETQYMMNADMIAQFSKPIYIINTSRGKNLHTADLVEALRSGKVMGACLDVLEYESSSFEGLGTSEMPAPMQYLIASDKVILSPHIAGWTHESNYKMSKLIAEKMIRSLSGIKN